MSYQERLKDLVDGWGYNESEAREILQDCHDYIDYHCDFEC